jgi:hypothetical protein
MNTVASILLHLDASASTRTRLDVARALAQRLGASITALYACAPQPAPTPTQFFTEAGVLLPDNAAFDARCREQARALIDAVSGGPPLHWVELPPGQALTRSFVREAWVHDLVVAGQHAGHEAAAGNTAAIRYGLIALALLAAIAFLPRLVRRLRGQAQPKRVNGG